MTTEFLKIKDKSIAFHHLHGKNPGVVFIHGFASDMSGEKALAIESFCQAKGQAFVRFDCRGHGKSSGEARTFTFGECFEDLLDVLENLTTGPQILVGSSMGGWLMLKAALEKPEKIAGLIGIAAAPDFTVSLKLKLEPHHQEALDTLGYLKEPREDGSHYILSKKFLDEAENHFIMPSLSRITCPIRLIQGILDTSVHYETALDIAQGVGSEDVITTFIKDGTHRLSRAHDIQVILQTIEGLLTRL